MDKKENEEKKKIKKSKEPENMSLAATEDFSFLYNGKLEQAEHDMQEGLTVNSYFTGPTEEEERKHLDDLKQLMDKLAKMQAFIKNQSSPPQPAPQPAPCHNCEEEIPKIPQDQVKKYVADRKTKERGVVV